MPADGGAFARRLLEWHRRHGRHDLPWQGGEAYAVWVSEIMLQQTQVATVIPYYQRFMARFPDLRSLAAAGVDDVLALWSGLGYYARARNLHRAAREVAEHHAGELPATPEALTALPGIGRSTAAAILALSRNERHAILDGNVKRVLARFHAVEGYPGATVVNRKLWALAERQTPDADAAEYTQAIMDLGATICTRAQPACERCPVADDCRGRLEGSVDRLPAPRPKRARPSRAVTVVVVESASGELLLERRPPAGVWGGLLSFPELAEDEPPRDWCRRRLGSAPAAETALPSVDHAFTHFDLRLDPVLVEITSAPSVVLDEDRWLWYNPARALPGGIAAPIAKLLGAIATRERRKTA